MYEYVDYKEPLDSNNWNNEIQIQVSTDQSSNCMLYLTLYLTFHSMTLIHLICVRYGIYSYWIV